MSLVLAACVLLLMLLAGAILEGIGASRRRLSAAQPFSDTSSDRR
jgi:hypothetical protein